MQNVEFFARLAWVRLAQELGKVPCRWFSDSSIARPSNCFFGCDSAIQQHDIRNLGVKASKSRAEGSLYWGTALL